MSNQATALFQNSDLRLACEQLVSLGLNPAEDATLVACFRSLVGEEVSTETAASYLNGEVQ